MSQKVPEFLFWGTHFSKSLTVATPLGMLRAKLHIKLKWQICTFVLHGLAWYCCLFVYLWLLRCCMILCCMIFCCVYCLLKTLPNCHGVCHPNNNMYAPLSTTYGGSKHGSPVFIRFVYPVANSPTHSLKSFDHFLLTVKDKPCSLDQRNVHYITN